MSPCGSRLLRSSSSIVVARFDRLLRISSSNILLPIYYYLILTAGLGLLDRSPSIGASAAPFNSPMDPNQIRRLHLPEKPEFCQKFKNKIQQPSTFLWRVKRQPAAYFFGTVHVAYTEVWEYVSSYAKEAFRSSDAVFPELVLTNPATIHEMSKCQLLPGDEQLSDHIPQEMIDRVVRLLERMKKTLPSLLEQNEPRWAHSALFADFIFEEYTGNWRRKRPIWLMNMLDGLNVDMLRHRNEPLLDMFLAQEANAADKWVGAIETPQEHCAPWNALDKKHATIALNRTLAKHEALLDDGYLGGGRQGDDDSGNAPIRSLVENYICGTLNETIYMKSALSEGTPCGNCMPATDFDINTYFRHELLDKRNERMADRVLRLLDSDREKSFFFAFGTAHFFGEDSVLELVKRAGYEVEEVPMGAGWYDEESVANRRSKHRHHSSARQQRQRQRKPLNARRPSSSRAFPQPPAHQPPQNPNWIADPNDASKQQQRRPSWSGETTPRQRIFQELWVRMDGYTPRPRSWRSGSAVPTAANDDQRDQPDQERLSSLLVAAADESPKSIVVVQYHYHSGAAASRTMSTRISLSVVFLVWIFFANRFFDRH